MLTLAVQHPHHHPQIRWTYDRVVTRHVFLRPLLKKGLQTSTAILLSASCTYCRILLKKTQMPLRLVLPTMPPNFIETVKAGGMTRAAQIAASMERLDAPAPAFASTAPASVTPGLKMLAEYESRAPAPA